MTQPPVRVDVSRSQGMTLQWPDGLQATLSVPLLRRSSPSADAQALRQQLARNPLTVLPASAASGAGPLRIEGVEPVGTYALRIRFSDGHASGLYTWGLLRALCQEQAPGDAEKG